jgi:putative transposase
LPRPKRRSLRLPDFDYSSDGLYFVTICSRDRACLFGSVVDDAVRLSRLGRIVEDEWRGMPLRWRSSVVLDEFVVMPNHLHGIVWLTRAGHAPPLQTVIGSFKSGVSRGAGRPVWQRSFHDRVIRNEGELDAYRDYVAANPVNWALDRENPRSAPRRGGGPPG